MSYSSNTPEALGICIALGFDPFMHSVETQTVRNTDRRPNVVYVQARLNPGEWRYFKDNLHRYRPPCGFDIKVDWPKWMRARSLHCPKWMREH